MADQNVEQLRQLVDARLPQISADFGDARIVFQFEGRTVLFALLAQFLLFVFGINHHGPEFQNTKRLSIFAFPHLTKENRAWRTEFDCNCGANKKGRQN